MIICNIRDSCPGEIHFHKLPFIGILGDIPFIPNILNINTGNYNLVKLLSKLLPPLDKSE